jgi:hypothetical protein
MKITNKLSPGNPGRGLKSLAPENSKTVFPRGKVLEIISLNSSGVIACALIQHNKFKNINKNN